MQNILGIYLFDAAIPITKKGPFRTRSTHLFEIVQKYSHYINGCLNPKNRDFGSPAIVFDLYQYFVEAKYLVIQVSRIEPPGHGIFPRKNQWNPIPRTPPVSMRISHQPVGAKDFPNLFFERCVFCNLQHHFTSARIITTVTQQHD